VRLFVDDVDVSFAQHHWPTWGRDNVRDYLETQRDLYRYVHDQTVRAMNQGRTGIEIAEDFVLPPELDQAWHARGYYGSISHNVKAVYQRYLGWYDGNPARLHRLPPEEGGRRYVAAMGGPDAVVALARRAAGDGDERWAAELLDHVVFGHPDHDEARTLQADVLEQLGYRQENATWRNAYLMGAKELRTPIPAWPLPGGGFLSAMETRQLWNVLAARLDGPASFGRTATVTWVLPDRGEQWTLRLRRGVLVHDPVADPGADATVTIDRADLDRVFANQATVADLLAAGRITITGTADAVVGMLGLLRPPDVNFAIITP